MSHVTYEQVTAHPVYMHRVTVTHSHIHIQTHMNTYFDELSISTGAWGYHPAVPYPHPCRATAAHSHLHMHTCTRIHTHLDELLVPTDAWECESAGNTTATHSDCKTLQHTATSCNMLQHAGNVNLLSPPSFPPPTVSITRTHISG